MNGCMHELCCAGCACAQGTSAYRRTFSVAPARAPVVAPAPGPAGAGCYTALDVLEASGQYTTFLGLLDDTDLGNLFDDPKRYRLSRRHAYLFVFSPFLGTAFFCDHCCLGGSCTKLVLQYHVNSGCPASMLCNQVARACVKTSCGDFQHAVVFISFAVLHKASCNSAGAVRTLPRYSVLLQVHHCICPNKCWHRANS